MKEIFLLGVLVLGAGLIFSVLHAPLRRRLRRMARTHTAEAEPGTWVKLVGQATAPEPVVAPIGGEACVYYQLRLLQLSEWDKETLKEVHREEVWAEGWCLEDEWGQLLVDANDAEVRPRYMRTVLPGLFVSPWAEEVRKRLLSSYDLERGTHLEEVRIEVNEPLVLLGRVEEGPRGRVLTGGRELYVLIGPEESFVKVQVTDVLGWFMVGVGLLLCVASAL